MRKFKFFTDPVSQAGPWVNSIARDGYRLLSVHNFIYIFEKTDKAYYYKSQFLAANRPGENREYLDLLEDSGFRTFRLPLNQGNITFFKFRLRPYARGRGIFANSLEDFNREILLVEGQDPDLKIFTDNKDLAKEYGDIRNAYLQGATLILILLGFLSYQFYNSELPGYQIFILIFLALMGIYYFSLALTAHRNYRKYLNLARIEEN